MIPGRCGDVLILGIETATDHVGVALGSHEGVLGCVEIARPRRHAELLVPAIESLCRHSDVDLDDVGVIAVDVGPGLFTGMRVGISAAKAMAQALKIPMIGISSLDLLAFPLRHVHGEIVSVIDARRGELYYAFYRPVPGGVQRVSEPVAGTPDDLVAEMLAAHEHLLLVGDGARRHGELLRDARRCELADPAHQHPSAASLVQLAHAHAVREEWVNPWELKPLYLRAPDAQINWTTRSAER
jgi:tRNA threonylcarbamoyladenosine biosynthesis protein TsaB